MRCRWLEGVLCTRMVFCFSCRKTVSPNRAFTYNLTNTEVMSPNSPSTTPLPLTVFWLATKNISPYYDFNAVSTLSGIWFWWRKSKKKAIFKYAEAKKKKSIRISLYTAIMWNLCVIVGDMPTPSLTSPLFSFFSSLLPPCWSSSLRATLQRKVVIASFG